MFASQLHGGGGGAVGDDDDDDDGGGVDNGDTVVVGYELKRKATYISLRGKDSSIPSSWWEAEPFFSSFVGKPIAS